jgi:hypothetical protein
MGFIREPHEPPMNRAPKHPKNQHPSTKAPMNNEPIPRVFPPYLALTISGGSCVFAEMPRNVTDAA